MASTFCRRFRGVMVVSRPPETHVHAPWPATLGRSGSTSGYVSDDRVATMCSVLLVAFSGEPLQTLALLKRITMHQFPRSEEVKHYHTTLPALEGAKSFRHVVCMRTAARHFRPKFFTVRKDLTIGFLVTELTAYHGTSAPDHHGKEHGLREVSSARAFPCLLDVSREDQVTRTVEWGPSAYLGVQVHVKHLITTSSSSSYFAATHSFTPNSLKPSLVRRWPQLLPTGARRLEIGLLNEI
jgi:hypothetical protein